VALSVSAFEMLEEGGLVLAFYHVPYEFWSTRKAQQRKGQGKREGEEVSKGGRKRRLT